MGMKASSLLAVLFWCGGVAGSDNGPCDEFSAKQFDRIHIASGTEIIVCAEDKKNPVSDLTVVAIRGGEKTTLFEGDAAFKSYTIHKKGAAFVIDEALNETKATPFLRIDVSCQRKSCGAKETCLWTRKKPSEDVAKEIRELRKKGAPVPDKIWTKAFYAALDGAPGAIRLFESGTESENSDVSGSEAFETYKSDLIRLKKAGCL